jgi:HEAT repeat protein
LYKAAREALNRSDYRRAATLFDQITSRYPKSAYSGDAYYYRAFALYRAGGEANLRLASRALDEQHSRFPRAKTADDANELRVRIRGELAKRGDADAAAQVTSAASEAPACPKGSGERDNDESDIRTAALNALLQMDSESALPIIKQVLQKRDACSAAMRKKAVFLLSQKQTSETEATLIDVVRNDPSKDVRETAVFWLGQVHTDKAASMLEEIATSGADVDLRDKAIFALSQSNSPRATAFVRRIAENPDVPGSLRGKAIFQLGQHPSAENAEYLRTLYAKLGKDGRGDDLRRNLLFSLSQMRGFGNDKWLLSVAADGSQSEEVRKQALFAAGQAGVSGAEMASIYDRMTDRELKYQLIWVLSDTHDRAGSDKLVEIAQKDRDPEMRKKAIFWLGQKNDPRIRQILLDIITKP